MTTTENNLDATTADSPAAAPEEEHIEEVALEQHPIVRIVACGSVDDGKSTLIGRLRSITVTFIAGIVIGLVNALVTPIVSISQYRDMTPFILATIALLVLSGRRGSALAGRAG